LGGAPSGTAKGVRGLRSSRIMRPEMWVQRFSALNMNLPRQPDEAVVPYAPQKQRPFVTVSLTFDTLRRICREVKQSLVNSVRPASAPVRQNGQVNSGIRRMSARSAPSSSSVVQEIGWEV